MNVIVEDDTFALEERVYVAKCYLCDHTFAENEEAFELFVKRLGEDGQLECSLSAILSSALGREIEETEVHSKLMCVDCKNISFEFEKLVQRFCEMRYKILSAYNLTAQRNNLPTIAVEINGVIQEPNIADEILIIDKNAVKPSDNGLSDFILTADSEIDLIEEVPEDDVDDVDNVDVDDCESNKPLVLQADNMSDNVRKEYQLPNSTTNLSFESEFNVAAPYNNIDIDGEDIIVYDEIIEQITAQSSAKHDINEMSEEEESNQFEFADNMKNEFLLNADDEAHITDDISQDSSTKNTLFQENTNSPSIHSDVPEDQLPLFEQQGEKYCCLICTKRQFLTVKAFKNHMLDAHSLRFYSCDMCSSGFLRREDLNKHIDEQHITNVNGETSKFECETCNRIFSNYRLFRTHMRMHLSSGSSVKQHECTECHKKYSTKSLLEEHMNMHTGERPYKCEICPKNFASKYTLQAHIKIHGERQRPFSCDECGKAFLKQQNLTEHKKLHSGLKPFVCELCSKSFGSQHNLDVHKITHSGQRPFLCRTCGKAFARRAEVRDHERIHTGERPFKCDICTMAFAQRSNLLSHKKSTHLNEKLHKCEECDRSFKRRRLLEYHMNAAHRGLRPYVCDICGASFVYPEHHKKHMLIHTGKKPFACEVCGKEFNSRDNRNAHRFVHSDKKPYECLECGAGFMRKSLLLSHMKHTKHTNDTIIINQPQINGHGVLALTNSQINFDDATGSVDYGITKITAVTAAAEASTKEGKSFDHMYFQSIENDFESADNAVEVSDSVMGSVNGQLIKDQIGEVKYLQFEELDRDGHQTLTWVDIGSVKEE